MVGLRLRIIYSTASKHNRKGITTQEGIPHIPRIRLRDSSQQNLAKWRM